VAKEYRIDLADPAATSAEAKKVQERLRQAREKAPSSRLATEQYIYFRQAIQSLGNPYDVTHIPLSVLNQMERDPMLAFGLHFIRTPILRAPWIVEAEDAQVAAFIDNAFRRIRPRLLTQYSGIWNYGFKPVVKRFQLEKPEWTYFDPEKSDDEIKVWDEGGVNAVTWKHFVSLPSDPDKVELRWTARGDFNGFRLSMDAGRLFPFQEDGDGNRIVDVRHALWFVNERSSVHESLYGFPRVGYAYRPWWSYWNLTAHFDRFLERKADPPYKVWFPTADDGPVASDANDDPDDDSNKAIAEMVAESVKSGGAVLLPSEVIRGFDDRPSTMREWDLEEMAVSGDVEHFLDVFRYYDIMKLRSLWIPEQALIQGQGGQSSRNVAKEELTVMRESQENIAEEFDEHVNRFVIPDLVAANFPEYKGEVNVKTRGFAKVDQEMIQRVIELIGASDVTQLRNVDMRELLDMANIPQISRAEIRRQEEEAIKELENAPPPVVEPIAGQTAGTVAKPTQNCNAEAIFYQQPRPIIYLSSEDEFRKSLPLDPYADDTIANSAVDIRNIWKQAYGDVYNDFAKYIESKKDLKLAEDDRDPLESLLKGWRYPREKLSNIITRSQNTIKRAINRGASMAQSRFGLDAEWSVDRDTVAEWLDKRGAELVRTVDETVKEELRVFLSEQVGEGKTTEEIADAVRQHFADFPDWKADRLARSEIGRATNFSTIDVGDAAGINRFRARDAQLGPERSDPTCIERNNSIFDAKDAIVETEAEHPSGTLTWTPLRAENLSIQFTEQVPSDVPDALASYVEADQTIYLSNSIPHEEERKYLSQILDSLELSSG
jgi:hypothetical protein